MTNFSSAMRIGIIPARMGSHRFPGKPLAKIAGVPMIGHVWERARASLAFDKLFVAGCDPEIEQFCGMYNIPYIHTSNQHVRALDRVWEAFSKVRSGDKDIIVCVQGDEPTIAPGSLSKMIEGISTDDKINAMMLVHRLRSESEWMNPNNVKVVFNHRGEVLYTSRAPVPYMENFCLIHSFPYRVGGIFAFREVCLKHFAESAESTLEKIEMCDSNRILESDFRQIAFVNNDAEYYSVDSPEDLINAEAFFLKDRLVSTYRFKYHVD
jgi:3-deoxy-manno-octulosonate cytidylyltransferase (CMP-KDO synthetase)